MNALWGSTLDLTGPYRLILLGDGYSWDGSHSSRASLTDEIPAGNGYTTGGVAATIAGAVDGSTRQHLLTITPASITPGPITGARYAAIVRWRGGAAAADNLIAVHDMGVEVATVGAFSLPPIILRSPV